MKLWELLLKIQQTNKIKIKLSGNSSGADFEVALKNLLIENGDYAPYPSLNFKKHKNFNKVKALLINKSDSKLVLHSDLLNDICAFSPLIIYQPLGSQSYPDFLLIRKDVLIPFEIKFSTQEGDSPTWNSNLPHNSGTYIFGSRGKQDITFFNGADYLTAEEKAKLVELVNKKSIELEEEGYKITNKFSIYLREMYNQKFSSLNNPKRFEYENKVIEILKEIEK